MNANRPNKQNQWENTMRRWHFWNKTELKYYQTLMHFVLKLKALLLLENGLLCLRYQVSDILHKIPSQLVSIPRKVRLMRWPYIPLRLNHSPVASKGLYIGNNKSYILIYKINLNLSYPCLKNYQAFSIKRHRL